MNGKYLLDKMELIDPAYIEAADRKPKKKPIMWKQWGTLAACIAAAVVSGVIMVVSPDSGTGHIGVSGDTASLFSTGGIPLVILVAALLAALATVAMIIRNRKDK